MTASGSYETVTSVTASSAPVDVGIGTGTANYTPNGSVSATFTGASMTSSGKFTPTGNVSLTTTPKTATVTGTDAGQDAATYTPKGTVTAPTISVATAGSTTSINSAAKKTVVTDMSVAEPAATDATGELAYYAVSGETLTFKKFVETTGDSITETPVTVKTGDASYSASAPTFEGTGAKFVTGSIDVPTSAGFTGTEGDVSVTGTTAGSVSADF